ncbi:hypothetical protein F5876DRAFT_91831 [Lentinula aff. lateritia]|uniref:Uncharacterized protein n=1 Tax=Lentinula aff. lateritia TaxID=2804960 RepID=A0ACC1TIE3_9AGAR|nr:hypothetical protein F5876DRAFT_91831 [Lentinula aff. lateritia]
MALPFKEALSRLENRHVKDTRPLIPPQILQEDLPLTLLAAQTVIEGRTQTENILKSSDDRLMVVILTIVMIRPCLVNNVDAAMEYAHLLKTYADEAKEDLFIVMHVYFEKPRTTVGWKGLINDPNLNGTFQINKGLRIAWTLLFDIAKLGLPAAIVAHTTESQVQNRLLHFPCLLDSRIPLTVGIAIDACHAAQLGHVFFSVGKEGLSSIVETEGNPNDHVILCGGASGLNYAAHFVRECGLKFGKTGLSQKIMIDCSHENSFKQHKNQAIVADDIAHQMAEEDTSHMIMGIMIESNLVEGRQDIPLSGPLGLRYGQSVTDACMDWDMTVEVFNRLREGVKACRARIEYM